jgi:acyl carrier protein
MLELDMDMEADLGIDSIKRVEILGAVRELYPDLPRLEAEELVELRTLGEIVDRYSGLWAEAKGTADVEEAQAPHQHALPHNEAPAPTASSSAAGMTQSLLQVVSEKTGYPEEMLELDMDMEADLGIDSIKRVEILGAMREHYPDLPKVEPDTFNELRTLGQIVAHLEGAAPRPFEPAAVVAASRPAASAEEMQQAGIQRGVVTLKALPEPDFLEMRLPAGHVSLVTDDGTRHTTRLVTRMLEQGLNPVVLRFPKEAQPVQADLPEGVLAVTVADAGEPALEAALSQVVQQAGPVAIFVHLDPPGSAQIQAGVGFSEQEKAVVKQVFLLAKHLKDGLNRAAKQGRSAFVTVTRLDGAFGLGNKAEFNPLSGGLFGLVKSLNLEWVGVFCRGIDLSPELEADRAAQNIMAELSDPNRLVTEVAYSPQGRWTLDVEPAHALEVTR